jgi:hypothetical protein
LQLKKTLKFVFCDDGVGVGVGILQVPTVHIFEFRLGQSELHGDGPNTKQSPPNDVDKHHLLVFQNTV